VERVTVHPSTDATTAASPPSPAPIDTERRQLTVLFCDLVGSTGLATRLDAEDFGEAIRAYHEAATQVVTRFGGHVAQHLGDGLLAYFGYPHAHDDSAEQAVRAALGIGAAVDALGRGLTVRVGLHSGLCVVSDVGGGGREETLALGETPIVAARVQEVAAPNTVWITSATQRLVAGLFLVESQGAHSLKGIREPVALYRVLKPSGVRSRLEVARAHGFTRFVGREDELRLLGTRWQQVRAGEGQVVLITGEAGIGKSRLVQMLGEQLANEPHTWIECGASPHHQNTPFYAVVDLIQQLLAWRSEDPAEDRMARLEQGLTVAGVSLTEAVPLLAPLLSLPMPEPYSPPSLSPEAQRRQTFTTLAAWLCGAARVQPVVAVLEDLQWADPSTLELQALLAERAASVPLLLLYTARPEFRAPWPLLGHHAQLTLNRLSRPQVREMVEEVAAHSTLPAEVMDTMMTRTDGVPLFIEELTKAVLEGQGSASARMIPMTLEDSLRARLDRLGPAKDVAQLGAVIGREFSYALARTVSPLSEVDLQRALTQLTDAELLYARGTPPVARYVFKHALVRDAAYASLLKTHRRVLHRAIAAALTEGSSDTVEIQPEVLALHYTEAGDTEPALAAWQRAGEQAASRSAHEEAIGHLRQALALLATLPESAERNAREIGLQFALATSVIKTRSLAHPDFEAVIERAEVLCEAIGDRAQLVWVLASRANYHVFRGELDRGIALAEQGLELARQTGARAPLVNPRSVLGQALFYRGNFAASLEHLRQAAAGEPVVSVAWCSWLLGYPDRALQQVREAVELERLRSLNLGEVLVSETVVHWMRGDAACQQEAAREVIALGGATDPFMRGVGGAFHAAAVAAAGAGEMALAEITDALAQAAGTGSQAGAPVLIQLLATVQQAAGQSAEALATLEMALAVSAQTGQPFHDAELNRLKGEITLIESGESSGEREDIAETCFRRALEIARRQEAKSLELRAATSLARLWQHQGKRDAACALLAPVYGWFTEGFDTRDLKDAKALLEELGA
jgi:class 3 adenylate cyclase/tetratricopeptide (TPR) repeat protein